MKYKYARFFVCVFIEVSLTCDLLITRKQQVMMNNKQTDWFVDFDLGTILICLKPKKKRLRERKKGVVNYNLIIFVFFSHASFVYL